MVQLDSEQLKTFSANLALGVYPKFGKLPPIGTYELRNLLEENINADNVPELLADKYIELANLSTLQRPEIIYYFKALVSQVRHS